MFEKRPDFSWDEFSVTTPKPAYPRLFHLRVGAAWSWFSLWSGEEFVNNPARNEPAMLQKVYASDRIVTLDELPNLNTYPLP